MPKKTTSPLPFSVPQVVKLAGVSKQAIHKAIRTRRLRASKGADGAWEIARDEARRFIVAVKRRRLVAKRRARTLLPRLEAKLKALKSRTTPIGRR